MLAGLDMPTIAALLLAGVALDLLLGEARRWHPLAGFGRVAAVLERRCNRGAFAQGAAAWTLAVAPPVALAFWSTAAGGWTALVLHAVLLYFCLGLRSLRDHMLPIRDALARGDLPLARTLTARIVSRETQQAFLAQLLGIQMRAIAAQGGVAGPLVTLRLPLRDVNHMRSTRSPLLRPLLEYLASLER